MRKFRIFLVSSLLLLWAASASAYSYDNQFTCTNRVATGDATWSIKLKVKKQLLAYKVSGNLTQQMKRHANRWQVRGILHEDTGIIDGLAIQQIRVNGKWRDGKKSRYVSGHTFEASRQNYFTVVLSSNKKGDSPILIDCYYERVMPAEPYYLWVLTNAGNTLYISQEKELYGRTPGSFEGGGTNWSAAVTYQPLAGPFHTREEAEAAFCKGLSARWTNTNAFIP